MSVGVFVPERIKGSRRLRRVAWTLSGLIVLLLIGSIVAWRIHKENEPEEYTPGEGSRDITSVLERNAPASTPAKSGSLNTARSESLTKEVPPRQLRSRTIDPLVKTGTTLPTGAPEPLFTDVTKAAGLGSFHQFDGPRSSQLPEDMGSGVAWGDFDNDGLDDLFVVSGGGSLDLPDSQLAPSMLYRNLGDGRFEKVQDFDLAILGMAAAFGDYNNHGWLDLVVTGYDTIILFRNDHGHLVRDKNFPLTQGILDRCLLG